VKNTFEVDKDGTRRKVRSIANPAFPESGAVINTLQNLAKYFGTGQHKQKLFDTQKLYSLQQ
jgi:hypothetical protein